MNKINNNTKLLHNITWYDINKYGHININLDNVPGIYIYKNIITKSYYVGSSISLAQRITSHRSSVVNWERDKKGCPFFYRSVTNYGWHNFKYSVLEYSIFKIVGNKQIRKALFLREQYYLDNINPSLNICKIAGSRLGIVRNSIFSYSYTKKT